MRFIPKSKVLEELAEKRHKAEEESRRKESLENASRDPSTFAAKTAFDLPFDGIQYKPWVTGDITDYFNYGLSEPRWIDYADRQLVVRQELVDAAEQKRQPDPNIVSFDLCNSLKPRSKLEINEKENLIVEEGECISGETSGSQSSLQCTIIPDSKRSSTVLEEDDDDGAETIGGVWGGKAKPGSLLAKLIEEQEKTLEAVNITMEDTNSLPYSRTLPKLEGYDASEKLSNSFSYEVATQPESSMTTSYNANQCSARDPLPLPSPIDESKNYRQVSYEGSSHSFPHKKGRSFSGSDRNRLKSCEREQSYGRGYKTSSLGSRFVPPKKRMREDNYLKCPVRKLHRQDRSWARY